MPAYLLGTQALIDSARNDDSTAIYQWASTQDLDEDDVVCSVASLTLFKYEVDQLDTDERSSWQRLFKTALARFQTCEGILPVALDVALRAAELRSMKLETRVNGRSEPLGDLGRIVIATALENHLVLVDRRQSYHELVEKAHGLSFIDPYTAWTQ